MACPPHHRKEHQLKKIILSIIFALAIFSACEKEQSVQPVTTAPADMDIHSNGTRFRVVDGDGITHYADSVQDKLIGEMWVKTLYQDGEIHLQFPYEFNTKGFSTLK